MSIKKLAIADNIAEVTERIEILRRHFGPNKKDFCSKIGFPSPAYSQITGSRGSKPNVELFMLIAVNLPNVNFTWLLTGQGEMLVDKIDADPKLEKPFEDLLSEKDEKIASLKNQTKELKEDKADLRERVKEINGERKKLIEQMEMLSNEFFSVKARLEETIDELKRELTTLEKGNNSA